MTFSIPVPAPDDAPPWLQPMRNVAAHRMRQIRRQACMAHPPRVSRKSITRGEPGPVPGADFSQYHGLSLAIARECAGWRVNLDGSRPADCGRDRARVVRRAAGVPAALR